MQDLALHRGFAFGDGRPLGRRLADVFAQLCVAVAADNGHGDKGVSFVQIGGNDEIMVTMLSTDSIAVPEGMRILFSYPLPAEPATRRTGLTVAVRKLHLVLPALIKAGARLEHVYDY
jgi:hypothetical protein